MCLQQSLFTLYHQHIGRINKLFNQKRYEKSYQLSGRLYIGKTDIMRHAFALQRPDAVKISHFMKRAEI
jgi:hypothetical protein